MTPTNIKFLRSLVGLTLTWTVSTNSLTVLAQTNKTNPTPRGNLNFCTLLTENKLPNLSLRLAERQNKLTERQRQREQNLEEKRRRRDEAKQTRRQHRDQRSDDRYDKLMARAQTEEQKQAVIAFQQTVETAVIARQTAIDAAIAAFRAGVDQKIDERQTAINAAIAAFKTATSTALEQAKTDCATGKDPAQVRDTFKTAMKAAHDKLKADRDAVAKLPDSLEPLIRARKTAVNKAISDFKATLKQALINLKTVLGEPAPTS